ncbi:MAG: methylornithine synthase PylB [Bacillota bacterium]|nr:methylornithine synthase PylB [Bacillota bacterium]
MNKEMRETKIRQIKGKARELKFLEDEEILFLLNLREENETKLLFKAAREMRSSYFGKKVFLYGFIYFSTYCRNDCTFCFYRRSNPESERYRKSRAEIIDTAEKLTESGVHLLDLTMGEDPNYFSTGCFEELLETTALVKELTGMPVMISPGVVPKDILSEFCRIGVDWYACYQETHNRKLYEKLRIHQDYDERLNLKYYAHELGMLAEEGLLAGVGETAEDVVQSFKVMKELEADQVRVMSFVPQKGTPLENVKVIPRLREMVIIAIMRLLFPDRLIPASLDVDGISGLKDRLNAGANVITSLIPPDQGLCGVSQSTLDIREGGRTVAGTLPILKSCGLESASKSDYAEWIKNRKKLYIQV